MSERDIVFPEDFLWGTAVCSHQAEGHNVHSDWWEWERQGKIKDGAVSGAACDMLHRYPEDFALMSELGYNAFRFSVEWARIEPERGKYSEEALLHYENVLKELRKRNIKVCLTLYHWVLPKWMADAGGWTSEEAVRWFRGFVRKVVERLYEYVDIWCTLNEPSAPIIAGYVLGYFPPEKKDLLLAKKVFRNLLIAHREAWCVIMKEAGKRGLKEQPLIGIAMAVTEFQPKDPSNIFQKTLHDALKYLHNHAFLDALDTGRIPFPLGFNEVIHGLAKTFNYIGINYYTRFTLDAPSKIPSELPDFLYLPAGTETTEMGYEVYPPGFHTVLTEASQYGVPIYITENGIADESDKQRPSYVLRHLAQVGKAMKDGVDIRGYFYWTFIDNFEWKEGWRPHFGLIAMEPGTLNRLPRPSAYLYGEIAKSNCITKEMIEKYAPAYEQEIRDALDGG